MIFNLEFKGKKRRVQEEPYLEVIELLRVDDEEHEQIKDVTNNAHYGGRDARVTREPLCPSLSLRRGGVPKGMTKIRL